MDSTLPQPINYPDGVMNQKHEVPLLRKKTRPLDERIRQLEKMNFLIRNTNTTNHNVPSKIVQNIQRHKTK